MSGTTDGSIEPFDGLVCDLDGVVYRGETPIPGAISCLRDLERRKVRVVYCTNNSFPTPDDYVRKLRDMGLAPGIEDIVTSATVAGEVLAGRGLAGRRAYVVGGEGVRRAVEEAGLSIVPPDSWAAEVVVLGIDRRFTYDHLRCASRALRAGALFFATNDDATYPVEDGLDPGAGSLLAAVEAAAGRSAHVLGKPHKPMLETAADRFPSGARLAMVGDRPETDLDGARAMGWTTILVLSGVTTRSEAEGLNPQPDLVLGDLGELVERVQ